MSKRIEYTQDQWLALIEAIEDDGGWQAEDEYNQLDTCTPRTYEFVGPNKLDAKDRVINGCGNEALFEVAYEPHEHVYLELEPRNHEGKIKDGEDMVVIDHTGEAGATATISTVLVCAICDGIGLWPRYAHVMEQE